MITSIIVDDETNNLSILRKLLTEFCPSVSIVAEANDLQQAFSLINKHRPSLVFLDIEMPYGNGFDLLDKLMPIDFEVVFITAFNEYALKAFKYCAMDYLLKPLDIKELIAAVNKVKERFDIKQSNLRLKTLLQNLHNKEHNLAKIAVTNKDGVSFVSLGDIVRCEASGTYTYFHLKQGKKLLSSKNIGEYEELLPKDQFFRVHHSHVVNLNAIRKYHNGRGGYVGMNDGALIDVAVRRKTEFLSFLKF